MWHAHQELPISKILHHSVCRTGPIFSRQGAGLADSGRRVDHADWNELVCAQSPSLVEQAMLNLSGVTNQHEAFIAHKTDEHRAGAFCLFASTMKQRRMKKLETRKKKKKKEHPTSQTHGTRKGSVQKIPDFINCIKAVFTARAICMGSCCGTTDVTMMTHFKRSWWVVWSPFSSPFLST